MPPPAILKIDIDEKIYKCMKTDWQVDEAGPLMFRFLSKLRADGQVELVIFSQRHDNRKNIIADSVFPEADFMAVYQQIRQSIWEIFPKAKVEVEDFAEMSPSAYQTASIATPFGGLKIKLDLYFSGILNKLRWIFTGKTPKR